MPYSSLVSKTMWCPLLIKGSVEMREVAKSGIGRRNLLSPVYGIGEAYTLEKKYPSF
jgi:hypothetical protein